MITADHAQYIAKEFEGQSIGGCVVEGYHRHGASSVILLGRDGADRVAIKIYGKHLFNEDGAKAELERIQRQLALKDHGHPNIVRTRRAGQCERTGYHYLIMDLVDDPTIEEVLSDIPREKIRDIIRDVAMATLFLQKILGHVHRDIKPANIAINLKTFKVTLLDLALIRPVTGETATDHAPRFTGTKEYCPLEFINLTMTKDESGWNGVSFYQLGALLYSLIMRKLLFDGYSREQLLRAIATEVPVIDAADVPADLVQLARDCLQKEATVRLSLVNWNRFQSRPDPNAVANEADRLRDAVRRLPPREAREAFPAGAKEQHAIETAYKKLELTIPYHVRSLLNSDENLYPQHHVHFEKISDKSFSVKVELTYARTPTDVGITAFCTCEILDAASLLCRCELIVCLGAAESRPSDVIPIMLFNGSFVEGVFSEALDKEFPAAVAGLLNAQ
jgi:serine/threonine protein kinase